MKRYICVHIDGAGMTTRHVRELDGLKHPYSDRLVIVRWPLPEGARRTPGGMAMDVRPVKRPVLP